MLVPFATIVALVTDRLRESGARAVYLVTFASVCGIFVMNFWMVVSFLLHPTFQFYDAAVAIGRIVRQETGADSVVLGVSGADLSLMTGLPSISDVYGSVPLAEKIATYHPGWFLAWNSVNSAQLRALEGYRLVKVATYPVFDDDERDQLILFRLDPRKD
jgi:hypothetical protein